MDREISKEFKRRRKIKLIRNTSIIIILLIVAFKLISSAITISVNSDELYTAIVERRDLINTIESVGTVMPLSNNIETSPLTSKILKVIAKIGDKVNVGDTLLKLNDKEIAEELQTKKNQKELFLNKMDQLKREIKQLIEEIKIEKKILKINLEKLNSNMVSEKKLYEMGGSSKESYDKMKTEYEISKLRLKEFELKNNHNLSNKENSISRLVIELRQEELEYKKVLRKLDKTTVLSTNKGTLKWISGSLGSVIGKGEKIAEISNISEFKVACTISKNKANHLEIHKEVKIRDEDIVYDGYISQIDPVVEDDNVGFVVRFKGESPSELRLNQQLEVHVVTSLKSNVLTLKNGAYYEGEGKIEMFVVQGDQAVKKEIEFGSGNFDYVEVVSGLNLGDKVIIRELKSLKDIDSFKIKN